MYDNTTLWVDYTTLGICMTSFALQKTSPPLYHTKPQSLWLHTHLRNDITHPLSDSTLTVSLSSQPLHWYHLHFCMISHPLYLISYALYITSYPLLMSSHYSTYDSTSLAYKTTSSMKFKMYTIPVTSQSLVGAITPTVLRASHPFDITLGIVIASFALSNTLHRHFMKSKHHM